MSKIYNSGKLFLKYFLKTKSDQIQFIIGTIIISLVSLIDLFIVLISNDLNFFTIYMSLSYIVPMSLNLLFFIKINKSTFLSKRYKVIYDVISIIFIIIGYFFLYYVTIINPNYWTNSDYNKYYGYSFDFVGLALLDINSIYEIDARKRTGKTLWQVRKSDKELMKYEYQVLIIIISFPVGAILTLFLALNVKSIFNAFGIYDLNLIVGLAFIPFIIYIIYIIKFGWNFNDRVRARREQVIRQLEFEKISNELNKGNEY